MATYSSVRVERRRGADLLAATSRDPPRDAALLLCRAMGKDRAWLLTHGDQPLTAPQLERYNAMLARRARHEPMQYILGEAEFFGLTFRVTPAVLIPRPETEHLVEAVLERAARNRPLRIADVGTGSGAIAVALAAHLPLAAVDALDLSQEALAIARENADAHGLGDRIRFLPSDLLSAVSGHSYNFVVSNPPYIADAEPLEAQVQDWEPHAALFAGPSGLEVYHRLIPQARVALAHGGWLAMELGAGQASSIQALLGADRSWTEVSFVQDLQGIPRVVLAQTMAS